MVKIICGVKGFGKTKRMITLANEEVKNVKGKAVYISNSDKHMLDLNHDIRYVNAETFGINSYERFHGFISGIFAANYDVEKVYIDKVYTFFNLEQTTFEEAVKTLEKASEQYEVDFVLTLREDPANLGTYLKEKCL
jgi:hypothetical protein